MTKLLISAVTLSLVLCFTLPARAQSGSTTKPAGAPAAVKSANIKIGSINIVLPFPDGCIEMNKTLLATQTKLVNTTTPGNRLVAGFVPADPAKPPGENESAKLDRYMMVETSRALDDHALTVAEFNDVKAEIAKGMNDEAGQAQEQVNQKLKAAAGDPDIQNKVEIGKPVMLGTYLKADNAIGFLMMMIKVHADDGQGNVADTTMACGTVMQRVKERLIYCYVFAPFKDESSLEWVRKTSTQWQEQVTKAN
jgi:hypothetical protein